MLRHLFDHIKNEKLKVNCLFCSKVFGTVSSLKSHFYRHHSRKDLAATKFSTQPINSNETIHIESLDKENDVNENLTDNTNNIKPVSSYFLAATTLFFLKLKAKYAVTDEVVQIFYNELSNALRSFSVECKKLVEGICEKKTFKIFNKSLLHWKENTISVR
jgi:hypothetical protein